MNSDTKTTTQMSRRTAVKFGGGIAAGVAYMSGATIGSGGFANRAFAQDAAQKFVPHFFLEITVPGGFDGSYLLDARPLSMMAAGKKVIHQSAAPTLWEGTNGANTLAAVSAEILRPLKDDITVVNGCLMATGFDGHDQNSNFFATGNPFGGEYFVPHLNEVGMKTPLDFIATGFFRSAEITNGTNGVPLNAYSARQLVDRLKTMAPMQSESKLFQHIRSRMEVAGRGKGKFAAGSREMMSGLDRAPELDGILRNVNPDVQNPDSTAQAMAIVTEIFRNHGARSAQIQLFPRNGDQFLTVDSHGANDAKEYEKVANNVAESLAKIISILKETEYRDGQSLWDVTTIMFGSEFGRTLRQKEMTMENSGTDHNPLCNTIILGGKGVAGGRVIGASDVRDENDVISDAHTTLDPDHLKSMGMPFDFATAKTREDRPKAFDPAEYITMGSVVNSLYAMFGVSADKYWLTQRNGVKAGVLQLT